MGKPLCFSMLKALTFLTKHHFSLTIIVHHVSCLNHVKPPGLIAKPPTLIMLDGKTEKNLHLSWWGHHFSFVMRFSPLDISITITIHNPLIIIIPRIYSNHPLPSSNYPPEYFDDVPTSMPTSFGNSQPGLIYDIIYHWFSPCFDT